MPIQMAGIFGVAFLLAMVVLAVALTWLGLRQEPHFVAAADAEDAE